MEIFALLGEWDYEGSVHRDPRISVLLGVYASEDEARTAHGVYTRDGDRFIQRYYVERRTVGAPVDSDEYRIYIG